jgi:type I restriction enzyme M protein
VPVGEIRENKYDLSLNRYKEVAYEEAAYEPPAKILAKLRDIETEILKDLDQLEAHLK